MTEKRKRVQRTTMVVVLFLLIAIPVAVMKTTGQEGSKSEDKVVVEQWEYLAVAGPSNVNLTPTGNPRMRKEPAVPFGREAFVLEQHLDKLGANGWELIAVAGPPTDPAYYFKRRK
jgi:hypothetical protein